jgi:hypothetical protein
MEGVRMILDQIGFFSKSPKYFGRTKIFRKVKVFGKVKPVGAPWA